MNHGMTLVVWTAALLGASACTKTSPPEAPPFMQAPSADAQTSVANPPSAAPNAGGDPHAGGDAPVGTSAGATPGGAAAPPP